MYQINQSINPTNTTMIQLTKDMAMDAEKFVLVLLLTVILTAILAYLLYRKEEY